MVYFLGEERVLGFDSEEYIYLNDVGNDYLSASYKQSLGLKYIFENFKFRYVYVCGTDTYVNINVLEKYMKKHSHNENICVGGHGCHRNVGSKLVYYHSGGPGFIISYDAISKINHLLTEMVWSWYTLSEEKEITSDLITACDLSLCYYLTLSGCNLIIENDLFFHCNHRGIPCHEGHFGKYCNNCDIISCHNMALSDFDDYTKILRATQSEKDG